VTPAELAERLGLRYADVVAARGEVAVLVERDDLLQAMSDLRDDEELAFDLLSSLTATDWPGRSPRFWMAYELYSTARNHRLRVKVAVPEDDPRVPSVVPLWPTANWHEREVFDMYGVVIDEHPDLRRLLMPDDWEGHPLRKDYKVPEFYNGMKVPY